jgi:hypothetical protein
MTGIRATKKNQEWGCVFLAILMLKPVVIKRREIKSALFALFGAGFT